MPQIQRWMVPSLSIRSVKPEYREAHGRGRPLVGSLGRRGGK